MARASKPSQRARARRPTTKRAKRRTHAASASAPTKKSAKARATPSRPGRVEARSIDDLAERLRRAIPRPRCELDFRDPWQLLIATILSAQSTDRTVNEVTPHLFRRWPTAQALAAASQVEVEQAIRPTGFFRNKAKAIREASFLIAHDHGGEVPRELDQLIGLPGVARKTANVVLGVAYGIASGIVVDTHAARVAQRLALTSDHDPKKIERDLCSLFPRRSWINLSHRLVLHGRYVCRARDPECARCPLNELCPSRSESAAGTWQKRASWEHELVASKGAAT